MRPVSLWFLVLSGCGFVGESWYDANVRDADGDGAIGDRFGGPDCDDTNPDVRNCDADGDGFLDRAAGGDDCDDADADVFPGAVERCNGVDDDCDELVDSEDPAAVGTVDAWEDGDGDGVGSGSPTPACEAFLPAGRALTGGDCDDTDPSVFPGNPNEYCDLVDQDCDGESYDANAIDAVAERRVDEDLDFFGSSTPAGPGCVQPGFVNAVGATGPAPVDCDDLDPSTFPAAPEVYYDGVDQDCLGDADEFDADLDGFDFGFDCDDFDPDTYPSAPERCDGTDNNCNGLVDGDDPQLEDAAFAYFQDWDGDGFGEVSVRQVFCQLPPAGWVGDATDCDDANGAVRPNALELCNGVDDNCSGAVDENPSDGVIRYRDIDGDGFGSVQLNVCADVAGYVSNDADCDDADATVFPGAYEICGDAVRQDCSTDDPFDCDGDGSLDEGQSGGVDCDDEDPLVGPGQNEFCDGIDNDCDGLVDSQDPDVSGPPTTYYLDLDGDGAGGPVVLASGCTPPPQGVGNSDDCDDTDPDVFPGAPERCDGVDNDCDDRIDVDPVLDVPTFYRDGDDDGFGDPGVASVDTCEGPGPRWVTNAGDCDDDEPLAWTGADEVCDGVDNDCDALIDIDDPGVELTRWYLDGDGDGVGQIGAVQLQCEQPTGYVRDTGDCDDSDATLVFLARWYRDDDGDGFGDAETLLQTCIQPPGYVAESAFFDCEPGDPQISPAALEICDGVDNDCDGVIDDNVVGAQVYYPDLDGDGFGDTSQPTTVCGATGGLISVSGDCDDGDPVVRPGAQEVCDGADNDCDGLVDLADPDSVDAVAWVDADGDGFGDPGEPVSYCGALPVGAVTNDDDCDDTAAAVSPSAFEACDGEDNDCDGLVDAEDPDAPASVTVWRDLDGDGYGDPAGPTDTQACTPEPGWSVANTDCDDADLLVSPGAPEQCDGRDNDCDAQIDDDDPEGASVGLAAWFLDADGDGFGDVSSVAWRCLPAADEVGSAADCDDADAQVSPGAPEICDSQDNDCDGLVDDADPNAPTRPYFVDADGDGFGTTAQERVCDPGAGFALIGGDCDDASASSNPSESEICDGLDNDCDGQIDTADASLVGATPVGPDADGDGWTEAFTLEVCSANAGQSDLLGDCDDGAAAVNPGAAEVCNTVDDDCDGVVDDGVLQGPFYADADLDGFGVGEPTMACARGSLALVPGDCDDGSAITHDPAIPVRVPLDVAVLEDALVQVCRGGTVEVHDAFTLTKPLVTDRELTVRGVGDHPVLTTDDQGALFTTGGRTLRLENLTLLGGAAPPSRGAGVDATGGVVELVDLVFDGLTAVDVGGAVYARDGAQVLGRDLLAIDCGAENGGGGVFAVEAGVELDLARVESWYHTAPNGSFIQANGPGEFVLRDVSLQYGASQNRYEIFAVSGSDYTLADLDVRHGVGGIVLEGGATYDLRGITFLDQASDVQLDLPGRGAAATQITLRNVLFSGEVSGSSLALRAANVDGRFLTFTSAAAGQNLIANNSTGALAEALFKRRVINASWGTLACNDCTFESAGDQAPAGTNRLISVIALDAAGPRMPQERTLGSILAAAKLAYPTSSDLPGHLGGIGTDHYDDVDGDTLADGWERHWFGSVALYDRLDDPDADGWNNEDEARIGASPIHQDTDSDGRQDPVDPDPLDASL